MSNNTTRQIQAQVNQTPTFASEQWDYRVNTVSYRAAHYESQTADASGQSKKKSTQRVRPGSALKV